MACPVEYCEWFAKTAPEITMLHASTPKTLLSPACAQVWCVVAAGAAPRNFVHVLAAVCGEVASATAAVSDAKTSETSTLHW